MLGHVVLVSFWTLTCINWLRQEPYMRAWSRAYRDDGLIVIGVHTPSGQLDDAVRGHARRDGYKSCRDVVRRLGLHENGRETNGVAFRIRIRDPADELAGLGRAHDRVRKLPRR